MTYDLHGPYGGTHDNYTNFMASFSPDPDDPTPEANKIKFNM